MKLFLDTEFTDFIDCDLIAIGIVSEDGKEFYAERNEVDVGRCSAFVREVVLPLLGKEPAVIGSEEEIGQALKEWLAQFGGGGGGGGGAAGGEGGAGRGREK